MRFLLALLVLFPSLAIAQTETLPAIARETYAPQAEQRIPSLPPRVVSPPAVADTVVAERLPGRVVQGAVPTRVTERVAPAAVPAPTAVVEQPLVRERVAIPPTVTWWEAFTRNRFGFYDDGYVDDNWYYDYYEVPRPAAAVAVPATSAAPGYRTSWLYEPVAERGLFSW